MSSALAKQLAAKPRVQALRLVAKFLYCCAEGIPFTRQDCKRMSDMCWLQVPMKYRMDRAELNEIKARLTLDSVTGEEK